MKLLGVLITFGESNMGAMPFANEEIAVYWQDLKRGGLYHEEL